MNQFFLFSILLATVGCASSHMNVDSHVPTALLFSPETSGPPLSGRVKLLAGSAHKTSLARSYQSATVFSNTPSAVVINSETEMPASWTAGAGASLGLLKRLDFTLETRADAPWRAGLQWQILGPAIGADGFKMSLLGSAGRQTDNEVALKSSWGNQSEKLNNVSAAMKDETWSAGFSLGYRFMPSVLIMMSGNYQEDDYSGNVNIQGGNSTQFASLIQTTTGVIGAILTSDLPSMDLFLQVEAGLSQAKDRHDHKSLRRVWGMALGAQF